mmetsp:Transcript_6370/g.9787  ORF Transcript_6370/g.9787 Transcript_6370/m.9787 type:complete len:105 (-) Transcript_6370:867-1181(-)
MDFLELGVMGKVFVGRGREKLFAVFSVRLALGLSRGRLCPVVLVIVDLGTLGLVNADFGTGGLETVGLDIADRAYASCGSAYSSPPPASCSAIFGIEHPVGGGG